MSEAFETYECAGCTIELHYDEDPMSPREWDHLGTIVTWARDGGWGDEQLQYEPYDTDWSTVRWAVRVRRQRGATVVLPLRYSDYRSDGARVFVADNWDDANAVIMDTAKGREMTGVQPADIRAALESEIEGMNTYLSGEVYGYVVRKRGRVLDSCWGFYGDDGLREAKSEAEYAAEHEARSTEQVGFYEAAH